MGARSGFLSVMAALLLVACADGGASPAPSEGAKVQTSEDELFDLLPDQADADCTGRLEFVTARRVEGRSECSGPFSGSTDGSLAVGTLCVYSTKVEARTATDITAGGPFVCSDGNHGTVRFQEKRGTASGIATATATDGRVVSITYQ